MTSHCGTPSQPALVSGGLRGHMLCGYFAGDDVSLTFDCQPLPSSVDSGWLLTPIFWTGSDGKSNPNKAVVLKVKTPTQTELFIEWETPAGNRVQQQQVTPGNAATKNIGTNGQVGEAMVDDGFSRTWTLQFLLGTCMDVAQIDIFNVGSSGSTNGVMSAPLRVWFLHDPQEAANVSACM